MDTYIHKTERRLRIRSDYIRANPTKVAELIEDLINQDSIISIKHQKYAGSVAIQFDSTETDCDKLLAMLESYNWTKKKAGKKYLQGAVMKGVKLASKTVTTFAVSRYLGPAIGKMF